MSVTYQEYIQYPLDNIYNKRFPHNPGGGNTSIRHHLNIDYFGSEGTAINYVVGMDETKKARNYCKRLINYDSKVIVYPP